MRLLGTQETEESRYEKRCWSSPPTTSTYIHIHDFAGLALSVQLEGLLPLNILVLNLAQAFPDRLIR